MPSRWDIRRFVPRWEPAYTLRSALADLIERAALGVAVRARTERSIELAFDPAKIPAPKLIADITAKHAVDDVHVDEPAIEEVIVRFYDLHDAGEA